MKKIRFVLVIFATLGAALVLGVGVVSADCDDLGDGGDGNCSGAAPTSGGDTDWDGTSGDDTMTLTDTGTVEDDLDAASGNDTITIDGSVGVGAGSGDVYADSGNDTVTVGTTGDVERDIYGSSGEDDITIEGTVGRDVEGGDDNDDITISGTVGRNVEGGDGDDTVTLQDGADVGGLIDGGANTATGDTLKFEFTTNDLNEKTTWDNDFAGASAAGGSLTFAGNTYTWANFESLENLVQYTGNGGGNGNGNGNGNGGGAADGDGDANGGLNCGLNPYNWNPLQGQYERPFNMYCQPYTGDPNESALHGQFYGQVGGATTASATGSPGGGATTASTLVSGTSGGVTGTAFDKLALVQPTPRFSDIALRQGNASPSVTSVVAAATLAPALNLTPVMLGLAVIAIVVSVGDRVTRRRERTLKRASTHNLDAFLLAVSERRHD